LAALTAAANSLETDPNAVIDFLNNVRIGSSGVPNQNPADWTTNPTVDAYNNAMAQYASAFNDNLVANSHVTPLEYDMATGQQTGGGAYGYAPTINGPGNLNPAQGLGPPANPTTGAPISDVITGTPIGGVPTQAQLIAAAAKYNPSSLIVNTGPAPVATTPTVVPATP